MPKCRTNADIDSAAQEALEHIRNKRKPATWTPLTKGVTGRSMLSTLPYFDLPLMTVIDMMHIVQGVVGSHLFKTIAGDKLKQNLVKEQARMRKAREKADEAAEKALKDAGVTFEKDRSAWQKRTAKKRKMTLGNPNRAGWDEPPPLPPVYIAPDEIRVSHNL